MNVLDHFSLPYLGMKDGVHNYQFVVDSAFFAAFEGSPIQEGNLLVEAKVDKRASMSEVDLLIKGSVVTNCDRCLSTIDLPLYDEKRILIKRGDDEDDGEEVIYIKADQSKVNLASIIYEYIILSIPIIKVYDCESEVPRKCDMDVLAKLSKDDNNNMPGSNLWDGLQNIQWE